MDAPNYPVGEAVYFAYRPHQITYHNAGEILPKTEELPATILAVAHNLPYDIQESETKWFCKTWARGYTGWYYFVKLDLEEMEALGLEIPNNPTEVITEPMIIRDRIIF